MSDLVRRLRFYRHGDAADRIEELEAGRDALAEELEREKQHAEEWMLGARAMEQKLSLMADRISALEAALAKAQVGLETIRDIAPRSKFTKQIAACADDALKSISGAPK